MGLEFVCRRPLCAISRVHLEMFRETVARGNSWTGSLESLAATNRENVSHWSANGSNAVWQMAVWAELLFGNVFDTPDWWSQIGGIM